MKKILMLFTVISLFPFTSMAASFTVQQVKAMCENEEHSYSRIADLGFCMGFLQGAFLEYHSASLNFHSKFDICLPKGIFTNEEAKDIFLKWAKENPKSYPYDAASAYILALKQNFPCKESNQ